MANKTTCPKCGAKEATSQAFFTEVVTYKCGWKTSNHKQPNKCKLRMWKRRGKKAEKKLAEFQERYSVGIAYQLAKEYSATTEPDIFATTEQESEGA